MEEQQQAQRTVNSLRYSIGLIYLWFGILKFFAGMSPAEQIACQTIRFFTAGRLPDSQALHLLALLECSIGFLLLTGVRVRATVVLLWLHLAGTFLPFLLFPGMLFRHAPYSFTLTGQYIFKNIILVFAARVIWQAAGAPQAQRAVRQRLPDKIVQGPEKGLLAKQVAVKA
jgi:uncharacterized membrane protein YphA (DoxX/SURF4 family)